VRSRLAGQASVNLLHDLPSPTELRPQLGTRCLGLSEFPKPKKENKEKLLRLKEDYVERQRADRE
jgi:hypothetical protein